MPPMQQMKGQFQNGSQDMQNLIQVSSLQMQHQQMMGLPPQMGGPQLPLGSVLVDGQFPRGTLGPPGEYGSQSDSKKVPRRPSTNKVPTDSGVPVNTRMLQGAAVQS